MRSGEPQPPSDRRELDGGERGLREWEARFSRIFDASPVPITLSTAADGRYLAVNPAYVRAIGWSADELIGESALTLGIWRDREARRRFASEMTVRGEVRDLELTLFRRDGSPLEAVASGTVIELGGEPHFLVFIFDLSDLRSMEAELRHRNALLEQAQAVANLGSWVSEAAFAGSLEWSPEVHRIFGVPEGSFDGRVETFLRAVHPEDCTAVAAALSAALESGGEYRIDHRIVRPDGDVRWVHERARLLPGAPGEPARLFGIVQDITERRLLEEELRRAQKLEVVGRLAGGVAHDFNNLLTVILGYGQSLRDDDLPESDRHEAARQICHAADHAAALTRRLLATSRRSFHERSAFDLAQLVEELEGTLRRLQPEDIEISRTSDGEPLPILGDLSQIEQVVLNLAVNARDAMPRGGLLTVETARVDLEAHELLGEPGVEAGRFARLRVVDTGVGMSEQVLSHIFEPFFTTKPRGYGSGLGLSTVYGVVQGHGGFIRVASRPGTGSRFDVFLPLAREPVELAALPEPPRESQMRLLGRAVLLVEDDLPVLRTTSEILRNAGCRVIEVSSGDEAVELAAEQLETFDLLVSDVVMPGLSGPETYDRLRERRPDLGVLFTTGYAEWQRTGPNGEGLLPGPVLAKPFGSSELVAKIEDLLARRDRRAFRADRT